MGDEVLGNRILACMAPSGLLETLRHDLQPNQYGSEPRSGMRSRYTEVLAVTYKVFKSASPNAQFAGASGNSIVRTNFPAAV